MFHYLESMIGQFERGSLSRRELVVAIGALLAHASGSSAADKPQSTSAKPTYSVKGLNHIALNVKDIPRSRDWYRKHLGMSVTSESESSCFMRCGEHFLALFKEQEAGLDHYCYTIDDYRADHVVDTLEAAGLKPRRHGNRVYFDDPDGLTVQLAAKIDWD